MAKFFRSVSDFWNAIVDDLYSVISSYSVFGGELFGKVKDGIANVLGQTAKVAEGWKGE